MEERYRLAFHAFTHRDYNILCLLLYPLLETQKLKEHTRQLIQATQTEKQQRFIHFFSEATPASIQMLLSADESLESNAPLMEILNAIRSASEEKIMGILATLILPQQSTLTIELTPGKEVQSTSKSINESIAVLAQVSGLSAGKTLEWITLMIKHKVSLTENHKNLDLENFVSGVKKFNRPTDFWDITNLFSQQCHVDQVLQACTEDRKTFIYFGNAAARTTLLTPQEFQNFLSALLADKTFLKSFPTEPRKREHKGIIRNAVQNEDELLPQLQCAILESGILSLLTEKSKKPLNFTVDSHPYHGRARQVSVVAHPTTTVAMMEDPSSSSTTYEDEDTSDISPSQRRPSVMQQDRPPFRIRIQITTPILEMTAEDQEASFSQEKNIDLKIFMKNPDTKRIVNCQLQLTHGETLQAYAGAEEIAHCLEKLLIDKFGEKTTFIIKISSDSAKPFYYAKSQLTTTGHNFTHLPFLELLDDGTNAGYCEDIQALASAAFTLFDMKGNSALVLNPYLTFSSSLPVPNQVLAQTPSPPQSFSPELQALETETAALRAQSAQRKALDAEHLSRIAKTQTQGLLSATSPSSASKPRELFSSPAVLAAQQDRDHIRARLEKIRSHQKPSNTPRTPNSAARHLLAESPTSSSKPSSPAELAAKIRECHAASDCLRREMSRIRQSLSPNSAEIQATRQSFSPMRLFPPASPGLTVSPNAAEQTEASLNPNESLLGLSPSKEEEKNGASPSPQPL